MNDFQTWKSWYRRQNPTTKLTDAEIQDAYDRTYACDCESCQYRKAHGLMPVKMGERCTAPMRQLGERIAVRGH